MSCFFTHRSGGSLAGHILVCLIPVCLILASGCGRPAVYRAAVDKEVQSIIDAQQKNVLGKKIPIAIDRPSDILRRQLIDQLFLPTAGPASEGTDRLPVIAHWPEDNYPAAVSSNGSAVRLSGNPPTLSLFQSLEAGARNSPDFQDKKEAVFQAALVLYLEQDTFRNSLSGQIQSLLSADNSGSPVRHGSLTTGEAAQSLNFKNGSTLAAALTMDLAALLSGTTRSSIGITGDASLSIPLLRGSADHVVTEPLRQAERNLAYAILEFERFKKEYAVEVGSRYLSILKQMDAVKNAREDYRSRTVSARRSRRLADAGRLKEIEVDQAVQTELIARQRWISAREAVKNQLDAFKNLLGLPPDVPLQLDPGELDRLAGMAPGDSGNGLPVADGRQPSDSDPDSAESDAEHAGPYEINPRSAVERALANRLDIKVALGKVYDAQRKVTVAADDLGAELTLLGSASVGEHRTISTADLADARLKTDKGVFSALITFDLPFERSAEAVSYRNSFIDLEKAVRNVQALEDSIKLAVRNRLRELTEARETLVIQAKSVSVAVKRVKSIALFMDAGRAQTRDLLEAQDALLSAQNSLTAARVSYRIAELAVQRDMGVLAVSDTGLWQEFHPETHDVEK